MRIDICFYKYALHKYTFTKRHVLHKYNYAFMQCVLFNYIYLCFMQNIIVHVMHSAHCNKYILF